MQQSEWDLVQEERLSLASMLEQQPDSCWATPSLCAEWSVHHVLAHLVMTPMRQPRAGTMARALVHARGHLWRAGRDVAVTYARRPPQELLALLRDTATARTKPLFVVEGNILLDLVVHGQDIAVPLGLPRPVPDESARLALERIWAMGWPFHARRRIAGTRVECVGLSDTSPVWEAGSGALVRGSAGALALLMTGRTDAALPSLSGPGVDLLVQRSPSAWTTG